MKLLNKIFKLKSKKNFITIVSGLPRSGTSMMMRMLEAGGMEIVMDGIRKPDEDNPRGYYEFEQVKKIKEDSSWLEDCKGKAVKMVSILLYHLPEKYHYKIIFMQRDMQEMLASQALMSKRLGKEDEGISDEVIAEKYEKHLKKIDIWLKIQPNIDLLYIQYNQAIQDPVTQAARVNHFLGGLLDESNMARVVDPSLYRQRKSRLLKTDNPQNR